MLSPVQVARHDSPLREGHIETCTEDTRVELLNIIKEWAKSESVKEVVFWLNGRAGEGKSTIANTIAVYAEENGWLGASYFFSRQGERSLRTAAHVIPTLVYQLAQQSPAFRANVLRLLDENPSWVHLSLVEQAKKLGAALEHFVAPSPPPLIILDALDECKPEDAVKLLSALLGSAFRRDPGKAFPVKILITSRPEPELVATFEKYCKKEYRLHEMSETVVGQDIRLYLERSMLRVRAQLRLPNPDLRWFTDEELDILVSRAGTLFIFAATVVRLIKTNPPGPKAQLDSILLQASSSTSDYATLDAIYLQIISGFLGVGKIVSPYYVKVLGLILFLKDALPINAISNLVDLHSDDVYTTLGRLQSILTKPNNPATPPTFYHASFYDYVTSERCIEPALRFGKAEREAYIARRCLIVMKESLEKDMARIEDPLIDISTVPSLAQRIPSEIAYASRFWGHHLKLSARSEDRSTLMILLADFIGLPLLYWIEVCGVLSAIGPAVTCLQDALEWMVRLSRSRG